MKILKHVRSKSDTDFNINKMYLDTVHFNLKLLGKTKKSLQLLFFQEKCGSAINVKPANITLQKNKIITQQQTDNSLQTNKVSKVQYIIQLFYDFLKKSLLFKSECDNIIIRGFITKTKFHINILLVIIRTYLNNFKEKYKDQSDFVDKLEKFDCVVKVLIDIKPEEYYQELKTMILSEFEKRRYEIMIAINNSTEIDSDVACLSSLTIAVSQIVLFILSLMSYKLDFYSLTMNCLAQKIKSYIIIFMEYSSNEIYKCISNNDLILEHKVIHLIVHIFALEKIFVEKFYKNNTSSLSLNSFSSFGRYILSNLIQIISRCNELTCEHQKTSILTFNERKMLIVYQYLKGYLCSFGSSQKNSKEKLDTFIRKYFNIKLVNWKNNSIQVEKTKHISEICRICEQKIPIDEFILHSYYCKEQTFFYNQMRFLNNKLLLNIGKLRSFKHSYKIQNNNILNIFSKPRKSASEMRVSSFLIDNENIKNNKEDIFKEFNKIFGMEESEILDNFILIYSHEKDLPINYYEKHPMKFPFLFSLIYFSYFIFYTNKNSINSSSEVNNIFSTFLFLLLKKVISIENILAVKECKTKTNMSKKMVAQIKQFSHSRLNITESPNSSGEYSQNISIRTISNSPDNSFDYIKQDEFNSVVKHYKKKIKSLSNTLLISSDKKKIDPRVNKSFTKHKRKKSFENEIPRIFNLSPNKQKNNNHNRNRKSPIKYNIKFNINTTSIKVNSIDMDELNKEDWSFLNEDKSSVKFNDSFSSSISYEKKDKEQNFNKKKENSQTESTVTSKFLSTLTVSEYSKNFIEDIHPSNILKRKNTGNLKKSLFGQKPIKKESFYIKDTIPIEQHEIEIKDDDNWNNQDINYDEESVIIPLPKEGEDDQVDEDFKDIIVFHEGESESSSDESEIQSKNYNEHNEIKTIFNSLISISKKDNNNTNNTNNYSELSFNLDSDSDDQFNFNLSSCMKDCQLNTTRLNQNDTTNSRKIITTSINDFKFIAPIAKGGYGSVDIYKKKSTGDYYSIKTVNITSMKNKKLTSTLNNETFILSEINNDYCVSCYYLFQDTLNYYFVMEFMPGGDLFSLLSKFSLSQKTIQLITAEVILALEYLHSISIIHKDIKPENILISKGGHFKLTDFGLSESIGEDNTKAFNVDIEEDKFFSVNHRASAINNKAVGTLNYMAPEFFTEEYNITFKVDYWALGVLIYELYTFKVPFYSNSSKETKNNIINMKINWDGIDNKEIRESYKNIDDAIDLIKRFIVKDPNVRWGDENREEIMGHCFFKGFDWDKMRSIKCIEVLTHVKNVVNETNKRIKEVQKNKGKVKSIEGENINVNVNNGKSNEEKGNQTKQQEIEFVRVDKLYDKNKDIMNKIIKEKEVEINEDNTVSLLGDL